MDNNLIYLSIFAVAVILLILLMKRKEPLSLSQFPIPTCSTCKSCKFYTCGKCGTWFQEQNKIGQTCDCGGFNVYRTADEPSCYQPSLAGNAMTGIAKEGFNCPSCQKGEHVCVEAAGTYDSGSTWLRNLPCPAVFPLVTPSMVPTAHKQLRYTSEKNIYDHLQKGGLVIAANKSSVSSYALKKLQENTAAAGNQGYPDFYYIEGPIVVMGKYGNKYVWMTGYPISYNPGNYGNYVNSSSSWNVAKTAYQRGRKLLNLDAPVLFLSAGTQSDLQKAQAACMPEGAPESNTDHYYGKGAGGCSDKSCLWGPDYGSGNWLLRV